MVVTIQEHPASNSPHYRFFRIRIDNTHIIRATVTSHHAVVERWISHTLHINGHLYHSNRLVMGRAIRPTPVSSDHIPAIMTLCVNNSCLIYHNRHTTNLPNVLTNFLGDPRINFVSVWPRLTLFQFLASNPSYPLFYNIPIDVRFFIQDQQGNPVNADFGIYQIATEVLGFDIQPELRDVEHSYWWVMELTNDQIAQTCLDAFVPYDIGMRVRIWNLNRNLYFYSILWTIFMSGLL